MGSTARSAETIEDFKTALIARIGSLARTHRLLDRRRADGVVRRPPEERARCLRRRQRRTHHADRPPVELSSQLAVSLGMAVHELTTNAAKFGALSIYGGKVDVNWSVTIEESGGTLNFDWVESSGPQVVRTPASRLRLPAAGVRAARPDPGQGQCRLPSAKASASTAPCRCRRKKKPRTADTACVGVNDLQTMFVYVS